MTEETNDALQPGTDEARREKLRAQLAKGQERMRELREQGWKPVHRNPVEQAQANPKSVKAAVKAFCWECVGADADPGAKFRVRDCTVTRCALHPHRPWQNVKGGHTQETGADGEVLASGDSEDTSED
ncbi:hypothetical protein AB4Y45_34155 [Paraburkholderia sp. EG287A]|uniref:hypothetical protein n=1 Tax=Paraburkholderia sp. EG287A TaxID=3237012 RepID=UPI0034D30D68